MPHEIRIYKSAGLLQHFVDGELRGSHPARVGTNAADKRCEGDEATPVGEFFICAKNPRSRFHRSLCLSYPGLMHAERGLRDGLIDTAEFQAIVAALRAGRMPPQHTPLGGEIYLHGGAAQSQHTRGCVALEDAVIEELFDELPLGTPVIILP